MGRGRLLATALAARRTARLPRAGSAQAPGPAPTRPTTGDNPFNCELQQVGTGTDFPDPEADPFCVEFDKTQQNVTDFGLVDFLAKEPARVAAAVAEVLLLPARPLDRLDRPGRRSRRPGTGTAATSSTRRRGAGGVHVAQLPHRRPAGRLRGPTRRPSSSPTSAPAAAAASRRRRGRGRSALRREGRQPDRAPLRLLPPDPRRQDLPQAGHPGPAADPAQRRDPAPRARRTDASDHTDRWDVEGGGELRDRLARHRARPPGRGAADDQPRPQPRAGQPRRSRAPRARRALQARRRLPGRRLPRPRGAASHAQPAAARRRAAARSPGSRSPTRAGSASAALRPTAAEPAVAGGPTRPALGERVDLLRQLEVVLGQAALGVGR